MDEEHLKTNQELRAELMRDMRKSRHQNGADVYTQKEWDTDGKRIAAKYAGGRSMTIGQAALADRMNMKAEELGVAMRVINKAIVSDWEHGAVISPDEVAVFRQSLRASKEERAALERLVDLEAIDRVAGKTVDILDKQSGKEGWERQKSLVSEFGAKLNLLMDKIIEMGKEDPKAFKNLKTLSDMKRVISDATVGFSGRKVGVESIQSMRTTSSYKDYHAFEEKAHQVINALVVLDWIDEEDVGEWRAAVAADVASSQSAPSSEAQDAGGEGSEVVIKKGSSVKSK